MGLSGRELTPWRVAGLFALLSFATLLPGLLIDGFLGDDVGVHAMWQAHVAPAVWGGDLYPRWLPAMNGGFGSPAFFFYPPLGQWVASLWWPLLPAPGQGMERMVLGMATLGVAGAIGCWRWCRTLAGPGAAVFGGLIYLLYPYRLYQDVYQRCAFGEVAGLAVLPWILLGVEKVRRGDRAGPALLAVTTGASLFAHLPMALIGVGFAAAYALFRAWQARSAALALRLAAAMTVGVALGAAAALPALALFSLLPDPANLIGPMRQPARFLLFDRHSWLDTRAWGALVVMTVLALALGGLLAALAGRRQRALLVFLLAAVAVVLLLNTSLARDFWLLPTPLQRIQFPSRLNGIHVVAFALAGALVMDEVATPRRRALLAGVGPALLLLDAGLTAGYAYARRDNQQWPMARVLAAGRETGEFVLGPVPALARRFAGRPALVIGGDARIDGTIAARRATLSVASAAPSTVALHQFTFSGWACAVDGGAWRPAPRVSAALPVPGCRVPAGRHQVVYRLLAPPAERLGWTITLAAALVIAVQAALGRGRARGLSHPPDRQGAVSAGVAD